jgi:alpha-glucosidase
VKVYLPEGEWYSLYTGTKYPGNTEIVVECPVHKLPVFVKAGALIPMQPVKANTAEPSDTLILHVYPGASNSSFAFYEDDGATFSYQKGDFTRRTIQYRAASRSVTLLPAEGKYTSAFKKLKVIFHDMHTVQVTVNGAPHTLQHEINQFFAGLEKFDPISDPEPASQEDVHTIEMAYSASEITLEW